MRTVWLKFSFVHFALLHFCFGFYSGPLCSVFSNQHTFVSQVLTQESQFQVDIVNGFKMLPIFVLPHRKNDFLQCCNSCGQQQKDLQCSTQPHVMRSIHRWLALRWQKKKTITPKPSSKLTTHTIGTHSTELESIDSTDVQNRLTMRIFKCFTPSKKIMRLLIGCGLSSIYRCTDMVQNCANGGENVNKINLAVRF